MNNKDLSTYKDNALVLQRAKNLINMTGDIIKNNELIFDEWVERLKQWANENRIPEYSFPRTKDELLGLIRLDLFIDRESIHGYTSKVSMLYSVFYVVNTIPREFGYLLGLEHLTLRNADKPLPQELWKLPNLQNLWLCCYPFDTSHDLTQLQKLEVLTLSYGHIKSFPALPSNIKSLELDNNNISEFPQSIFELKELRSLYIIGNLIDFIPKKIERLHNLERFDIRYNPIEKIPDEIFILPNLKHLIIDESQKSLIPKDIIETAEVEVYSTRLIYKTNIYKNSLFNCLEIEIEKSKNN